jgi:lipoyl(octanoyl) transferase
MTAETVIVRHLPESDYGSIFQKMQQFNQQRDSSTQDEIWLLQHPPVFTLGLNGKKEHVLDAGNIPLVQTDRGGQVTYHGPGQLIAYILFDIRRNKRGVRELVNCLEDAVIDLLVEDGIQAVARKDAPGVYVDGRKVAALGLRVKKGGCYHGLSLNVDMDLAPFKRINPCGYEGLEVTSMRELGLTHNIKQIEQSLLDSLCRHFEIQNIVQVDE